MSDFIESEADESEDEIFGRSEEPKKPQKHQGTNDGKMTLNTKHSYH